MISRLLLEELEEAGLWPGDVQGRLGLSRGEAWMKCRGGV